MFFIILVMVAIFSFATPGYSSTYYVPDDFATIQEAIDNTVTGDTVLVRAGTYLENIDYLKKHITIRSVSGPELTVIDGNQTGSVVTMDDVNGAVLEGFTLTNGKSLRGGGINGTLSWCSIRNNIIHDNIASISGGGIYSAGGSCTIEENIIRNNSAGIDAASSTIKGGGICSTSSGSIIRNNHIYENRVISELDGMGGGIYASGPVENNIIEYNEARSGSESLGGGIYTPFNLSQPMPIRNNIIHENKTFADSEYTTSSFGGGICAEGSFLIENNTISRNLSNADGSISFKRGDGIYLSEKASGQILGNTIQGHPKEYSGAGSQGIYCRSKDSIFIVGNTIFGHGALSGIFCSGKEESTTTISNNHIHDNKCGIKFEWERGLITLNNNVISNNIGYGGIVFLFSEYCKGIEIVNNTFARNWTNDHGGALRCTNTDLLVLVNNTFIDNTARRLGGAVAFNDVSGEMVNNIIWGNHSVDGSEICLENGTNLDIRNCNLEGGQSSIITGYQSYYTWGTGMIDADPLFVDGPDLDFHLTYDSPCRDAGDPNCPALPSNDFENDPRCAYGNVDIGADEFHSHLYCTGVPAPMRLIQGKIVGLPSASPVFLLIGGDVLQNPLGTKWGDLFLDPISFIVPLPSIPSSGVMVLEDTVPGQPNPPYDVPMQALIGLGENALTNLYIVEIR